MVASHLATGPAEQGEGGQGWRPPEAGVKGALGGRGEGLLVQLPCSPPHLVTPAWRLPGQPSGERFTETTGRVRAWLGEEGAETCFIKLQLRVVTVTSETCARNGLFVLFTENELLASLQTEWADLRFGLLVINP